MSFNINDKLFFDDSFQFLSFLLHSLLKNLNEGDSKYLNQEFDNKVLDLVEEELPSKKLTKLVIKSMNIFLIFGIDLK